MYLYLPFNRKHDFLDINQSETKIACGGHVASYQVSVHLAKRFQRRRLKCEKLTDDGKQEVDVR